MQSLHRVRQTDRASERNAQDFETCEKQLDGSLITLSLMVKLTSSPVVSQSSININEGGAVRGSSKGDG